MGALEDLLSGAAQQQQGMTELQKILGSRPAQQQMTVQDMLDQMRAEGERYPYLGEAALRMLVEKDELKVEVIEAEEFYKPPRKHVESRVIETKQITGEKDGIS